MAGHHFADGCAGLLCRPFQRDELRRFGNAQPQPQAERDQQHTGQQRYSPSPVEQLLFGHQPGDERDRAGGDEHTGGRPHLREGGIPATLLIRAVFDGEQHRASPLTTERHALHETQRHQQDGREHAHCLVGRQQADQRGAGAHDEQRHHQHMTAAAAVAEISEQDAAEGPRQISHPVGRECQQRAGQRIDGRKKQLVEHQRRERVVHREVVVLERRARDAGERQALHVRCVVHFLPNPPPPGVWMTMTSSRCTAVENAASNCSVPPVGAFDPVVADRRRARRRPLQTAPRAGG